MYFHRKRSTRLTYTGPSGSGCYGNLLGRMLMVTAGNIFWFPKDRVKQRRCVVDEESRDVAQQSMPKHAFCGLTYWHIPIYLAISNQLTVRSCFVVCQISPPRMHQRAGRLLAWSMLVPNHSSRASFNGADSPSKVCCFNLHRSCRSAPHPPHILVKP